MPKKNFLIFVLCALSFALGSAHSVWAASFSYTDLVSLIQTNNITSIDSLLPLLPEELRSGYTLMYKSRSLQQASTLNPRVIMFGTDASLTCAFNGESSQLGYDHLECFQFDAPSRSFDFRQIEFPTKQNRLRQVTFSASGVSADGKSSCLACHGADPRPSWDGYSSWIGAYGSDDDLPGGDELTNYSHFVSARSSHPRYKWLIQGPLPTDPYLTAGVDIAQRPNLRFSDFVGRMNAIRTARILESSVPDWQVLAFALSGLKCTLSTSQLDQITQSGLPYATDSDPSLMFKKVGMYHTEWSTEITPLPIPDPAYEHQSGFGFLSSDLAMQIISERAQGGDKIYQKGLAKLILNLPSEHDGTELDFYRVLFGILPDPDTFGGKFDQHAAYFCSELASTFTKEYLAK